MKLSLLDDIRTSVRTLHAFKKLEGNEVTIGTITPRHGVRRRG